MATATASEACWTVVATEPGHVQPSVQDLKNSLEKGKEPEKIETMKRILSLMMAGDPLPQLVMHVIRFVLPSKNKTLKRLLLFYWELCPKHTPDGKLKQEMILVCNYLRNDLQSPNEFVRGSSLRFLCKLREQELLEPLVPSCRTNLEHRIPYVRKNAVFAILTVYKHFEHLIPDAPELIATYLVKEQDPACKRNAFLMLCNTDHGRALNVLSAIYSQIFAFDEPMQLAVIDLIKRDCRVNFAAKGKYLQTIIALLSSSSNAVKYEAAGALMSLTSSPPAVREVGSCFINLAIRESDNNVRSIVLEQLSELNKEHPKILEEKVMDVLRVLASPDIDVCRKTIKLTLNMLSSRNVSEVVSFLIKEMSKTLDPSNEKSSEYKQLLIYAIHQCAIKFPDVAAEVVHVLMEFLGDSNSSSAVDVILFVREVVERNPLLRKKIMAKLFENFPAMKSGKVLRGALWITGEYCTDVESIDQAFAVIRASIGDVPLLATETKAAEEVEVDEATSTDVPDANKVKTAKRILADGTYATESAFSTSSAPLSPIRAALSKKRPPLRSVILGGDYFLGTVLAGCLTKLVLRVLKIGKDQTHVNALRAEAMLIMTGVISVGQSNLVTAQIDEDSYDRILTCIRLLGQPEPTLSEVFMELCRSTFTKMTQEEEKKKKTEADSDSKQSNVPIEQVIPFRQLKLRNATAVTGNEIELDVMKAAGAGDLKVTSTNRLNRILQLTGFSDSIYAEAYVDIHQYDILLDVLLVNQTEDTLQNLTIEFAILGDLRLMEKPTVNTMGPRSFLSIKSNIKVSSTETGIIFGNITYDGPGASDTHVIVMSDIHLDIVDYIKPESCTENQFRAMWTEFEWENKVNVNTNITNIKDYLNHILKATNMSCLTPEHSLGDDCGFLSANLYARSIFGEDALANISLEQHGDTPVVGHIRIRSKTQGIALSLGDKITITQKVRK